MTEEKQKGPLDYFNYLGSMITYDARPTPEIKSKIATAKNRIQQEDFFRQHIGLKFKEETSKVLHMM